MEAKKNILTYEGLKRLEDELEDLKVNQRKAVAEKIKEAREQGDLSENAEYDAAKDEQRDIEARIEEITMILKNADVVVEDEVDLDKISIGCKVKVLDCEYDEEMDFKIVGSTEANSLKGKISNESPLGKELIGAKVGETIVVETQAGDVSAYIPTNVISITDGQIYLETEMFNAGFRPAVNAGLSVSRVGGAAQIKAMKKIAAPIRVELAQYRELAAFSQFGSELDDDTKEKLAQGERIKEILKQPQYQPMPVQYQVIIIYAATNKFLLSIPVADITRFEKEFFEFLDTKYPEIPNTIAEEKVISDELDPKLRQAIEEFKSQFK